MATRFRVIRAYSTSISATMRNLGVVVPIVALAAAIAAPLDAWLAAELAGSPPRQEDLLSVGLAWTGVALALEVLYGPIMAAVAVYVTRNHVEKRKTTLYGAVNFAMARYKRMFLPHLGAQLSIQLGMTVVVPGILFMMMYAFVDPVSALEDEKWPMARSSKLTRGRRKSIFMVALPFILLSIVRIFLDLMALGEGTIFLFIDYLLSYLLVFWLWSAFTVLYLDRVARKGAADVASPSAAGDAIAGQSREGVVGPEHAE